MRYAFVDFDFSVVGWHAWQVVIVGISITFLAMALIYLIFRYVVPLFFKIKIRKIARTLGKKVEEMHEEVPADANAAIAMALYLYFSELHDEESYVITINRVSRTYSPWSSKLYNMRYWQ